MTKFRIIQYPDGRFYLQKKLIFFFPIWKNREIFSIEDNNWIAKSYVNVEEAKKDIVIWNNNFKIIYEIDLEKQR